MSSFIPSPASLLNAANSIISTTPVTKQRSPLGPPNGAPLSGDPSLIPSKYLNEKEESGEHGLGQTTSLNRHPARAVQDQQHSSPIFVRSPPSTLLDAPARAAMSLPNSQTASAQARAVRGGEVTTPEYELDEAIGETSGASERIPLLAPQPTRSTSFRPSLSRVSSAASSSSNKSVLRRIFIDRSTTPSQHLTRPTFPPPSLSTYSPLSPSPPSFVSKVHLLAIQTVSLFLSTQFLAVVVCWALFSEFVRSWPKRLKTWLGIHKVRKFPWDDEAYWRKEGGTVSKEPKFYARQIGMDIENQVVETEDGYLLRVHKVIDPDAQVHSDNRGGFPVLILHGLFQSSGSFVTSEDRSLAFWLAKKGKYQVYLGNTRGVFNMGHRRFGRNDPRFWDWTIRELAMYDLPALVEHVCRETGYDKIAFIGHSQGNGLAFISLSLGMCPSLGNKLSLFIALAPAVYAGSLTTGFPFTVLNKLEWNTWKRFFGVLDFIPLMRWAYDWCPARIFAALGYVMFAFLFSWTDTNWLHRRKTKMFRFTPTPVSSASIFWWCGKGGFADRKCTLDDSLPRWFDDRFPPLSIYHGGRDYLVFTDPLLERLRQKEKDVRLIKCTKLEESEHCDFYWAAEAVEWAYLSFLDDIESTRSRYPDETDLPTEGTETDYNINQ
ncbi:hypothetical protein L204_102801 [Cryptococcus depauperatus]|nr:lipid particle protein [Cryptococcus depauperatus CBS 7855]